MRGYRKTTKSTEGVITVPTEFNSRLLRQTLFLTNSVTTHSHIQICLLRLGHPNRNTVLIIMCKETKSTYKADLLICSILFFINWYLQ